MEGSFMSNKRPFDHSATTTADRQELNGGGGMKRPFFKPPPPPLKLSAGETLFRILCPGIKTGGVIGKGGAIIRQFREETGAKIRIDDSVPGCDERVILIVAETLKRKKENNNGDSSAGGDNNNNEEENLGANLVEDDDVSPAQKALIRVFERILKVDEERVVVEGVGVGVSSAETSEDAGGGEEEKEKTTSSTTQNLSSVVCRLLAPSNQVGCVLGRGGKIVEKIRQGSGAQVRVLPKDHIPSCASPGDELIQITGNFSAVRKALLSVSSCLQENSRADATSSAATKPSGSVLWGSGMPGQVDQFPSRGYPSSNHALDYHSRGYSSIPGSESNGASHRKIPEEEVVYRLLCHLDKVGSLIGKGGSIIRSLQSETGASIKIADAAPDSDERVVLISARENSDQRHSPAQDAVIRVHSRIAEVGFEPGAAVVARLLVPSQQIGCLLGKGGNIIAEMRRSTGTSIRIFAKEQVPKCGAQNDEVVQVIGNLPSVQDALFHITSRVRETIFPVKLPFPSIGAPPYLSGAMEGPIPMFRSRHEPGSPGHYPSSVGFANNLEHSAGPLQHMDRHPVPMHGIDHPGVINLDRVPYPYANERSAHGPTFDRSSPRSWAPQSVSNGNPRCAADSGIGFSSRNGLMRSGSQVAVITNTTVEVVVPMVLLGFIIGENNCDLNQIRQISGAKVVVHDGRPGNSEGIVLLSGTTDQIHAAQNLIHAFILSGQTTT